MTATFEDVQGWIEDGKRKGATHVISVCDTFSYDDYPVYVYEGDVLSELKKDYSTDMQRINEVIKI